MVGIKLSGGTAITNGVIYFDEFYIKEDTGFTSGTTTLTAGAILPKLTEPDVNNNSGSFSGGKWNSGYQFCSGTTLNNFYGYLIASEFPYAIRNQQANHFACAPAPWVCDLTLKLLSITSATTQFSEDGAFEVEATTNAGDFRYAISETNPLYSVGIGQATGVFSNLFPGTYKVWAVDEKQCAKNLTITVPYDVSNTPQPTTTNTYAEKYRMDYKDVRNAVTRRVSIWERNFNGTYVEVKGGVPPFERTLTPSDLNDKFDPIRETASVVNFTSERDLQFIGLFSQDDRKFQVRYQNPVGTEQWRGYVVPSVFSEPYTRFPPYYTTIQVADGLTLLENEPFVDRDGNHYTGTITLIYIVSEILDKLDLDLSIRIGANISENSHNGVKPFEETQYKAISFYEEDGTPWECTRVLRSVLMPFGAKIVQEGGYWNIVRVEEQTATYNVRIYDADGTFNSTSTYDPILAISSPTLRINSAFVNADHVLEVNPAYGKITVNHKLFPKVSLLDGYSFEDNEEHTLDWDAESQTFKGWTVDKTAYTAGTITISPKLIPSEDLEANYALEAKGLDVLAAPSSNGNSVNVISNTYVWRYSGTDSFSFSFKYALNVILPQDDDVDQYAGFPLYIRLRYQIKKGIYYFTKTQGWIIPSNEDQQWNNIYVSQENYNKTLTESINNEYLTNPSITTNTSHPVNVTFKIEGRDTMAAQNESGLAAIVTTTKEIGYRIKIYDSTYNWMYFILREGTTATSWPDIKRPTDYATTTNEVYWELEKSTLTQEYPLASALLDDVRLKFYPNYQEPPKSELLEKVINENFKEQLEVELEGGDITSEVFNNKLILYNNTFLDQNGQLTDTWGRSAFSTEATTIQNILLKSLVNQYRYPSFRFSGSLVGFTDFGFLTTLKHTQTAPSLSLTNEEFTGSSTGWSNSDTGTSWAYDSNDVQVILSGATDSKLFGQSLTGYAGQRISIEHSITRSSSSGIRGDWFICALTQNGTIVQEVVLEDNMISDGTLTNLRRFSFDNDFDAIHFYVRNIAGTGSATYDVDFFRLVPMNIVRYYTPNRLSINDKMNEYNGEWTQLIPVVFSSDPTIDDSGEGNTGSEGGGGGLGGGSAGDYDSRDYDSRDYDV
jgi:hypothetical protein